MASIKIQTGLRLSEEPYEKLKQISQLEGRSLNNLIEFVLQRFISDYEAENGAIRLPDDQP